MLIKPPVQFADRHETHPPEPQQPKCRLHVTLERVQAHPARAGGLLARQRKPRHRTGDNLTARRVRITADAHLSLTPLPSVLDDQHLQSGEQTVRVRKHRPGLETVPFRIPRRLDSLLTPMRVMRDMLVTQPAQIGDHQ